MLTLETKRKNTITLLSSMPSYEKSAINCMPSTSRHFDQALGAFSPKEWICWKNQLVSDQIHLSGPVVHQFLTAQEVSPPSTLRLLH